MIACKHTLASAYQKLNIYISAGQLQREYLNTLSPITGTKGPTEIRTRIAGFKVQSANHYTMGPPSPYLAAARSQSRSPMDHPNTQRNSI